MINQKGQVSLNFANCYKKLYDPFGRYKLYQLFVMPGQGGRWRNIGHLVHDIAINSWAFLTDTANKLLYHIQQKTAQLQNICHFVHCSDEPIRTPFQITVNVWAVAFRAIFNRTMYAAALQRIFSAACQIRNFDSQLFLKWAPGSVTIC